MTTPNIDEIEITARAYAFSGFGIDNASATGQADPLRPWIRTTQYHPSLEAMLAAYERPFDRLIVSYSMYADDEWGSARNRTCISHPACAADEALRVIAQKYYGQWVALCEDYHRATQKWHASYSFEGSNQHETDRVVAAAEGKAVKGLAYIIRNAEAGEYSKLPHAKNRVAYHLVNDPAVIESATLSSDPVTGYLSLLWSALVNHCGNDISSPL